MSTTRDLVARRRAYRLLGAMLVEGVDADRLEAVRAVPPLAEALPDEVVLDELAAEHYALFGHEVHPFAGAFLDPEGLVGGGPASERLREAHRVVGVACPDDPSPDHLGAALQLMAVLVDAELEAQAHGDAEDLRTLQTWQRRVLDEALLPWMAPLFAAIGAQPPSLWTRAVEMAVGVLARHRAEDPRLAQVVARGPEPGEMTALLDERRTGLHKLARVITTPAHSGVYLSRRDVQRLAEGVELPRGFGSRVQMLDRLLRGAAEYGLIPRVLEQLRRLLLARDDVYATLMRERGLAVHVIAWRRRVQETLRMLEGIDQGARLAAP